MNSSNTFTLNYLTKEYPMRLQDKVVLITGNCRRYRSWLAKEGAKLVIIDLNKATGEETLKELQEIYRSNFYGS